MPSKPPTSVELPKPFFEWDQLTESFSIVVPLAHEYDRLSKLRVHDVLLHVVLEDGTELKLETHNPPRPV